MLFGFRIRAYDMHDPMFIPIDYCAGSVQEDVQKLYIAVFLK